jgi:hypothetical protein
MTTCNIENAKGKCLFDFLYIYDGMYIYHLSYVSLFLIEMSFKPFTMTISIITVVLKFLFGKAGEMFILVDNVVDHHLSFF